MELKSVNDGHCLQILGYITSFSVHLQRTTGIGVLIPFTWTNFPPALARCNKCHQQELQDRISLCICPNNFCFSSLHPRCKKTHKNLLNFKPCVSILLALGEFQDMPVAGLDPTPQTTVLHGLSLQGTKYLDLDSAEKFCSLKSSSTSMNVGGTAKPAEQRVIQRRNTSGLSSKILHGH